jgi:membrane protein
MSIRDAWAITKQSFKDFMHQNVLKLSAALAYFTIFALPGLLIIIIWVSDLFYGRAAVEGTLYGQIESFVGHTAAVDIQKTIKAASLSTDGPLATIIGALVLVVGATTIFGEVQTSINSIWHLKAKPKKGRGLLKMILNRLLSFSMILSLGFILLVSLIINGAMDFLLDRLMEMYPVVTVVLGYILNLVLTFFITAFIFAAIFKMLPDARIKWKHVRVGAAVTAVLFMVGKFLISYYLDHNKSSTTYGAAGYLIVVLLWVYYSAMILYFGAAFTHAYVVHKGSRIMPNSYAVWVQQVEVESGKSLQQQPEDKTVTDTPDRAEKPV